MRNGGLPDDESVGETSDPATHGRGVRFTVEELDGCAGALGKTGVNTESGVVDYL